MNLFDLLTDEEKNKGKILEIEKNKMIFYEKEKCNQVYFLLDGEVIIASYDIDGNEEVYNHLYKNDLFGNVLIFADNNEYLGSAFTAKKSLIFILEKKGLLEILKSNDRFLVEYLKYNSNETMISKIKTKMLSKRNIKDRIIYYLSINKGSVDISITKLAKELMLNRVCVSRVISSLISERIIIKKGKRLVLVNVIS